MYKLKDISDNTVIKTFETYDQAKKWQKIFAFQGKKTKIINEFER